ncbi:hypothetical protein MXD59_12700 [Frankia sp. Ag45/Mut15]|uniref:Uncharacterized protein n=1 Tax=Frankia umida TaxID=573489 RepID=A0ABT0JZH4_9ACTN|nr:hypothetical protein [Frankia umida]MCK9876627.1 hypothetical protein [Frankia umida]
MSGEAAVDGAAADLAAAAGMLRRMVEAIGAGELSAPSGMADRMIGATLTLEAIGDGESPESVSNAA